MLVSALGRTFTITRHPSSLLTCTDELGRPYEVAELDLAILVWFDARRAASVWQLPSMGHDLSRWTFVGRVATEIEVCHMQDLPENGCDSQHLPSLHGPFVLPGLPQVRHRWQMTWKAQPAPLAHVALLTIDSTLAVCSQPLPFTELRTSITQLGPAMVHIVIHTRWGLMAMREWVTPITPTLVRAVHVWHAQPSVPWLVAKVVALSAQLQFDRDVPVWSRKRFVRAPMVVRQDGPILNFRRWMAQFYEGQQGGEGEEEAAAKTQCSDSLAS